MPPNTSSTNVRVIRACIPYPARTNRQLPHPLLAVVVTQHTDTCTETTGSGVSPARIHARLINKAIVVSAWRHTDRTLTPDVCLLFVGELLHTGLADTIGLENSTLDPLQHEIGAEQVTSEASLQEFSSNCYPSSMWTSQGPGQGDHAVCQWSTHIRLLAPEGV